MHILLSNIYVHPIGINNLVKHKQCVFIDNIYTFLFLFIVALTACVVLFGFTSWHFWLVSRAETTIEFHMNSTERKRLKEKNEIDINKIV